MPSFQKKVSTLRHFFSTHLPLLYASTIFVSLFYNICVVVQCLLLFWTSPEEDSNDEDDEDEWETGAPARELLDTSNYERSEGLGGHRQFDMKQLLTEQDEDTIGEYLKRKYADSHERRFVEREGGCWRINGIKQLCSIWRA